MKMNFGLESEFDEVRLTLPALGNRSIPSPFSRFGRSIDRVVKSGGFHLDNVCLLKDSEIAELKRIYLHKNSGMIIKYDHGIRLQDEDTGELLPEVAKGYIKPTFDRNGWIKGFEAEPNLFYDLYSRDDFSCEDINLEINNSYLSIGNGRGTILEYEKLNNYRGDEPYLKRNKMFLVDGDIDIQDKDIFFPTSPPTTEKFENGVYKIHDLYVSEEAVFTYLRNVVSNLKQDWNGQ